MTEILTHQSYVLHSWGGRLFSGGKFTEASVRRADRCSDFFSTQTLGELKFFAGGRSCFFWQKCEEESGGQVRGQTLIIDV